MICTGVMPHFSSFDVVVALGEYWNLALYAGARHLWGEYWGVWGWDVRSVPRLC